MDIEVSIKQALIDAVTKTAKSLAMIVPKNLVVEVVSTRDSAHGDLSASIAFVLAKLWKRSPGELAAQIANNLPAVKSVDLVETAGPYINFFIAKTQTYDELNQILKLKAKYGRSAIGKRQKVQVEFISANPTGPLTLGNARGGFLGDAVARILEFAGYDVTREYYFNNAGTQIKKLVESVQIAAAVTTEGEQTYSGQYVDDLAKKFMKELKETDADTLGSALTTEIFETLIKPAITRMGVSFDVWFNESDLVKSGEFERTLKRLRAEKLVYEKEGAIWLKSTALGDQSDRVLVKSSGDNSYLGNDIAYHINIFEKRNFDIAIKHWGADHAAQVPSLKLTIAKLFPDKDLQFVIHQFVRLIKNGKEYKISKRAGTFVTVDDLLSEVSADVARFFFLMRSPDTHMDFDLDLAKEHSQKNPVYYVQYAHARIASIIKHAGSEQKPNWTLLTHTAELELIRQLLQFPKLVEEISSKHNVHALTHYTIKLADTFHVFYEQCRVIDDKEQQLSAARLALVKATQIVFKNALTLLGVSAPEQM